MNQSLFFSLYNLAHHSSFFDSLVIFTAVWLGNILILGAIVFLFFHHDAGVERHTRISLMQKAKEIAIVFCAALAAWIASALLKHIIGSLRPFDAISSVHPLFSESGFGFPSGHATFFSALAMSVYLYHKKLGVLFAVGALLIGISRVIGGVHYPFDIIGGFVLGPIVAFVSYRIVRWFGHKYGLI